MAGVRLVYPRDKAETAIRTQIEKGQQLLDQDVRTAAELDSLRSRYWGWGDYNETLLESLFDTDTISKEYKQAFAGIVTNHLSVDKETALFKGYLKNDINQLESILNRLELFIERPQQPMIPTETVGPKRDVFICHAGEDKGEVVRPIAAAFDSSGISYWLDEAEILWADSILEKINEGLRASRYVLVVLSSSFLQKPWPQKEFNAAMSKEAGSGEVHVLPLLVGGKEVQRAIIDKYPLLADKNYLVWNGETKTIVSALQKRLGHKVAAKEKPEPASSASTRNVYVPPIKRKSTQLEKDLFLKQSLSIVKSYFQDALQQLKAHYPEVDTDFTEIHTQKFICKIYVAGEIKHQCKVWVGDNSFSSGTIVYSQARQGIENDGAMNEMAVVEETPAGLAFSLVMAGQYGEKTRGLSSEELAEGLWKRFVLPLAGT